MNDSKSAKAERGLMPIRYGEEHRETEHREGQCGERVGSWINLLIICGTALD